MCNRAEKHNASFHASWVAVCIWGKAEAEGLRVEGFGLNLSASPLFPSILIKFNRGFEKKITIMLGISLISYNFRFKIILK